MEASEGVPYETFILAGCMLIIHKDKTTATNQWISGRRCSLKNGLSDPHDKTADAVVLSSVSIYLSATKKSDSKQIKETTLFYKNVHFRVEHGQFLLYE